LSRRFVLRNINITMSFIGCCLLTSVTACDHFKSRAGIFLQYEILFSAFRDSKLASHLKTSNNGSFSFPLLEIYNRAGHRVYAGHETRANTMALHDIGKLENGSPPPNAPDLDQTMIEIGQVASIEPKSIPSGQGTVFTINLDRCQACSIQDDYLSTVKPILLQNGISVVEINVVRTSVNTMKGR
jgi:hypothetical protein